MAEYIHNQHHNLNRGRTLYNENPPDNQYLHSRPDVMTPYPEQKLQPLKDKKQVQKLHILAAVYHTLPHGYR